MEVFKTVAHNIVIQSEGIRSIEMSLQLLMEHPRGFPVRSVDGRSLKCAAYCTANYGRSAQSASWFE